MTVKQLGTILGIVFSLSVVCTGQNISAIAIEKVLEEPAQINFKEISLENAFFNLEKTTGIKFDTDQARTAISLLPFGQLTEITATLQGMSWRNALQELLKPLALRYQTGQDRIYILGTPELLRQPRRLNLNELNALVRLQTNNVNDSEKKLLKQLRDVTGLPYGLIENSIRKDETEKDIVEKIVSSVPQPASRVLDLYCQRVLRSSKGAATWYIRAETDSGRTSLIDIVILPAKDLVEMKLEQRINIKYKNQSIQTILQDLAQQAAVNISFEPGCIALLSDDVRDNSTLVMHAGTIKDALEALSGMTGLGYNYDADGIHISASETLRNVSAYQKTSSSSSNPLICTITEVLPGTSLETMFFIRKEDLEKEGLMETYKTLYENRVESFMNFLRQYKQKEPIKVD
jgi:hypothetical protein